MSTYEPGTVAMVRDNVSSEPSEWRAVRDGKGWLSLDPRIGWVADSDVTDVRPLVVLDAADSAQIDSLCKALVEAMYAAGDRYSAANGVYPATVRVALDSLNKPPRIPEPGWGSRVSARAGDDPKVYEWIRFTTAPGTKSQWIAEFCSPRTWAQLIDPERVS